MIKFFHHDFMGDIKKRDEFDLFNCQGLVEKMRLLRNLNQNNIVQPRLSQQ